MASVAPFPAIRFQPERAGVRLEALVAPPYDVINAAQQDALYAASEHNVVRLILNRETPADLAADNRYTRAAACWKTWRDQGILGEDPRPAFYVHEQEYTLTTGQPARAQTFRRRGVFVAVLAQPFGQGQVFPHEETFAGPKQDRLNLMQATAANLSPVFGLAPDASGALKDLLASADGGREPDSEVAFEGVLNRLWKRDDEEFVQALQKVLGPENLFIADGHHRYETACTYRRMRREALANQPAEGARDFDYALMFCVPMGDPGLIIQPTHRVLDAATVDLDAFLTQAKACFTFAETTAEKLLALAEAPDPRAPVQIGLVMPGGAAQLLTATPALDAAMREAAPDKSEAWRGLDVAALHEMLLLRAAGLDPEKLARKEGITFTKDAQEALETARQGRALAFILRPTRLDQLRAVSEAGEKMPQKSTYFYPKLLSGLVFRQL
jgi:uncharacterized protein (DUF1015 family)